MDGYLQTALVASGPPLSPPSQQNRTSHLTKLLKPCPPSNKEFNCDNFHAVEGTYSLVNEIHFDTIAPQFSSGTRISILDVRPKQRLAKSTSSATTNSSTATNDTPLYHHEDDKSTSSTATIASSSLASPPPPPPLSLEAARTISTPLIVQQAAPQLSPSLLSSTTTLGNSPLTATLDSMGITRSTALPIPNVTARSYDSNHSSSTSFQPGTTTTNGTLTPPHSRATPNSSIPTALPSPANATLTATPTPTSSTPFALHHPHHLDSASAAPPEGISDLSTSVSSLSALFSRRNSVRYMHSPQRKPKNNLVKTKSSFVLRMIIHDRLAQVLANRTIDDSFLFFNIGTSFLWMDAKGKPKDPLSRIVFTKAYPTCHDINLVTKSSEHLDVIIGFSSGDCVWYDPLTSKYFRLNKDGNMKRGSVTNVKWIPGSEDLFMASFADGTILILDKDREDQAYTTPTVGSEQFHASRPHKSAKYNPMSHWSALGKGIVAFEFSPDGIHLAILGMDGTLRIMDYHQERVLDIFTSYYGNFLCVAWSPDGRYLLTGGQDDLVTIWGFTEKRIVSRCQGHKSWVTKVAFDPYRCDDKVYRFGSVGEDCKLILWDFSYSALHRPKTKHHHRTTGTTPKSPRSPKDTHRFSFVGADPVKTRTPMLAQMFNRHQDPPANEDLDPPLSTTSSHHRQSQQQSPPHHTPPHHHHHHTFGFKKRSSTTISTSPQHHHRFHLSSPPKKAAAFESLHLTMPTLHPAPNKTQVPLLQPSTIRTLHADPCVDLVFRQHGILTADRRGRIRTWGRP